MTVTSSSITTVLCSVMCCHGVRFGVVVKLSDSSSPFDLSQSVDFGSGAVHLVVVQSTDNKALRYIASRYQF